MSSTQHRPRAAVIRLTPARLASLATRDRTSALSENDWATLERGPSLLETSLPGVYAVGDVRANSIKRVAAAAGEGSMAVRLAQRYLGRPAS